jgi:putative ABC transport system substrate-binding protein
MRHIGVHIPLAANDLIGQGRITAFLEELQQSGWIDGRNVRIDYRWSTGDDARIRKDAAELVALAPDLILATGSATVGALLQATRTIPVVFPIVIDPVGAGFVESLARPGGNATGFLLFEYGISGKWLELQRDCAPRDASGDPSRSYHCRREWTVRCNPVRGSVVRGGAKPVRSARRW